MCVLLLHPPKEKPVCGTWQAATVVGGVSFLDAGSSVLAGRGAAGHVRGLTVLPGVVLRTAAVV